MSGASVWKNIGNLRRCGGGTYDVVLLDLLSVSEDRMDKLVDYIEQPKEHAYSVDYGKVGAKDLFRIRSFVGPLE